MKTLITFSLLWSALISFSAMAQGHTCRMETNDISQIVAHGSSKKEAYEAAVTECVNRRESQFLALRGHQPDMDRYEDFVVACANTACQTK